MQWLDIIQGPIDEIVSEVDQRSRSLDVKGQNRFLLTNSVQSRRSESPQKKKKSSLFNSLSISAYDYRRQTDCFKGR